MADNFEPPLAPPRAAPSNLPEFTVGELSDELRRTLEEGFGRVRVRGEVSGLKRHTSGHVYFSLKDDRAVLDAVCWRGTVGKLGCKPEDGMEVVCVGRITTYGQRSKYQIVVDQMELAGEGALLKLLEERRKKLAVEGLFDAERKKALPYLPEVIGVVTSLTGAVIRDILHRLEDRFPRRVLVWPVAVQGEGAAAQVAAAIRGFNALDGSGRVPRPDLLIVARGGGSLEDLWAFNEEIVVRAAAESRIPLISAVGHETDTTLIDYASDHRAPTPTAAAERAVPVRAELLAAVLDHQRRLSHGANRLMTAHRRHVEGLARGLTDPRRLIEAAMQRFDHAAENLRRCMAAYVERRGNRVAELGVRLPHPKHVLALKKKELNAVLAGLRPARFREEMRRHARDVAKLADALRSCVARQLTESNRRLAGAVQLLESLSYERVLDRGFALVRDARGGPVTRAAALKSGAAIAIHFRDGEVGAVVADTKPHGGKKPSGGKGGQGSLL